MEEYKLQFIKENYGKRLVENISKEINESKSAIFSIAHTLRKKGIKINSKLQFSKEAYQKSKEKRSKKMKRLWKNPKYLGKMKIRDRQNSKFMKINNPMFNENSKEKTSKGNKIAWQKKQIREKHLGKNHPLWKGNKVSYSALHNWLKREKLKPKRCENCKREKKLDLANISKEYKRDINDYKWLCRSCHKNFDKTKNENPRYNK